MRDRVARLRGWLAGGVILLLIVIASFIGYGRYVSHLRRLKLPLPPGVNIVREAGGWTYSRAEGSKTLYTIHAAKFEQGKSGKMALHDVSVVLYGKKDDRRDRVYGENFEYDQKGGVLRALGQVHIDLEGAAAERAADAGHAQAENPAANVMHVTTSELVYLEKLGVAATSEDVDVQTGQMSGHARGADYSSDSGMLMLHSSVEMSGNAGGRPVHMTAAQAQFDQRAQEARLTGATYESQGKKISAERAVLHRRKDGGLDKVDADGNVTLTAADGKAVARRAELRMNAAGHPASAILTGGVVYTANQPLRQVRGEADDAQVSFAASRGATADHALFTGSVHMVERTRASEATKDRWNSRDLTGGKVEVWLAAGPHGRTRVRNAEATGSAKLVMIDLPEGVKRDAGTRTEVAADELKATMSQSGPSGALDEVAGRGHTSLLQVNSDGVEQASEGDTLLAKFNPSGTAVVKGRSGRDGITRTGFQTLSNAVQQGHVSMTRRVSARQDAKGKISAEEVQRAVADRASYDGAKDQVLLAGDVRLGDSAGTMWAQQIVVDRSSGDARAVGPVKVDYTQSPGGEPMHLVADRAVVSKARSTANFFGNPVRVWQGGNQVQAPEVDVDRAAKQMVAHGGGDSASSVRTLLVNATGDGGSKQPAIAAPANCGTSGGASASGGRTAASSSGSTVRITSASLVYSGAQHQIDFSGGVRADTADATVRSAQAIAYLKPEARNKTVSAASLEGGLERMVATGHVELTRVQARVTGEQLVYEAGQRKFLLSGSGREPARAVDSRGTSTAAAFRFTACSDTLEALGDAPGATQQRVETEAPASAAGKREKTGR